MPNFLLQFPGEMFVSVVVQEDEGEVRELGKGVFCVKPRMKPQDYTYEENIGYTNWEQLDKEAKELLAKVAALIPFMEHAIEDLQIAAQEVREEMARYENTPHQSYAKLYGTENTYLALVAMTEAQREARGPDYSTLDIIVDAPPELPPVTEADNGKVLGVVDGAWDKTTVT